MDSYSQFGEDQLILEYFNKKSGVFVEVGAFDPVLLSQTYLLEQNGWSGVLVEPLPHLATRLRSARPRSKVFECAVSSPAHAGTAVMHRGENDSLASLDADAGGEQITVQTRTLDQILQEAGLPQIDFLSMDVEGFEMEVFAGFDLRRWQPSLVLLEDHVHDLRKHQHMLANGYQLVNRLGCNSWYIPASKIWTGPRHLSTFGRIRKLYLGLPFRKLKLWFKRRPQLNQ